MNTVSYQIRLPQFEGPFDLLLFFIERDELDIYNIPITSIINDFLAFIKKSEEDNIELRTYVKNELKNEYIIKEAENGLEGIEKATKYIPDIIITDVMMPIMDGFETIKKHNKNTNLETVAKVYAHGSIIESNLMSWMFEAFRKKDDQNENSL